MKIIHIYVEDNESLVTQTIKCLKALDEGFTKGSYWDIEEQ